MVDTAEPRPAAGTAAATFPEEPSRAEHTAAFFLPAIAVVGLALDGGAFDVVVRGEWGLAIWWALGLGIAAGFLPRRRPGRAARVLLAAFGALAGLTAFALVWTESDERTSAELARVVMLAGVFALTAAGLRRETWATAVAGLTAGAAVISVLAVASRLLPGAFPDDIVGDVFHTTRLSYPLNYWNAVGAWCAVTVALTLSYSAHSHNRLWRAAALAVVPVAVTGAYLTYSRATVGGIVLAAVCVFAFAGHRWVVALHALAAGLVSAGVVLAVRGAPAIADGTGGAEGGRVGVVLLGAVLACAAIAASTRPLDTRLRLRKRLAYGVLATLVLAVAVLGAVTGPGLADRAWDQFTTQKLTASQTDPAQRLGSLSGNRYNVWSAALDIGDAHPWNGVGPGTFEYGWNRDGRDREHVRDAHSFWFEAWAELGVPGVIVTVALAIALLWIGLVARRRADRDTLGAATAVLAALVVTGFHASFDWIWESTANAALALALAGAAAAAASGPRVRYRLRSRIPVALFPLLLVLVQLPPVVGTSRIRDSQAAAARGDDAEALAAAADAVAIQPWAATPYVQRALLQERAGALRAAETDLLRAREREPTNWRHALLLARVLAEQGRASEAVQAFEQARKLRPRSLRLSLE